MELIDKEIRYRAEVDVVITAQAQRILNSSNFSLDEFKQWAMDRKGGMISFGGNDAAMFLEAMHVKVALEDESLKKAEAAIALKEKILESRKTGE